MDDLETLGLGTEDAAQMMALLRPFGSVTVLNGHIHQVLQKVEGNVALHTAMSIAYPCLRPALQVSANRVRSPCPPASSASCWARAG